MAMISHIGATEDTSWLDDIIALPPADWERRTRKPKLRNDSGDWMTPGEVLAVLGCAPKTLVRWADAGIIRHFRTPGGHRRYLAEDVWRMYRSWRPGGRMPRAASDE